MQQNYIVVTLFLISLIVSVSAIIAVLYLNRSKRLEAETADDLIFSRLRLELLRRDDRIDELESITQDLRREVNGLLGAIEQMKVKLQKEVKTREHLETEVNRQKTRIVILESENVLLKKRNSELANRLGTSPLGDIENE